MRTLRWSVDGMHCAGCARTVEALLCREPGVRRASVWAKEGEARIQVDAAGDEERLATRLEEAGFRVVART